MLASNIITIIRKNLNLTQEELARQLDVSYATVNRWETGKNTPSRMAMKNIIEFCQKHNISLNTNEGDN